MKKILGSFLIVAAQFAFSQNTRNVGDFSSLKVYDKINVVLVHSEKSKVETDGNADLETVNKNGELKIRMAPTKVMQGDNVSVKVFYENLNDVQASQGSSISSRDVLESKMLTLVANEGSKINVSLEAETLNAKTNSGGQLELSGTANHQDVLVNTGGKFLGKNIDSQTATVAVNAGGIAEVNVSDSVSATTRAGGVIDVYGDPDDRQVKNVIGGKINFK
ncbi:DUF2807 domain-containing protein [Kaistella sp. 97-N-M2]|uniref:head GIN domain-containing protein n=1 Tax=Kaistella sp. 97-N-M2 TaxID=2908645 RepID=UPI001F32D1D5|nr:head GIN domain-containing protein [Kaistella sp. 97-N-M2]UJF28916.1 DUF2807 domain-containing protein [Kaistella sp. 97-N-M2]